jgi:hypothetical protein
METPEMDEETRKLFLELGERIEELERKVDRLMNEDPGSWGQERLQEMPQEIFGDFVRYLALLDIGLSTEHLRRFIVDARHRILDAAAERVPEASALADWERARFDEIIARMLPPEAS